MPDVETATGAGEPNKAAGQADPAAGHFVYLDYSHDAEPEPKNPALSPQSVVRLGIAAIAALFLIGFVIYYKSSGGPAPFQDLGAGISNATGIKGRLKARWEGKAEYQLEIEPIDPLQSQGFSYVAANPPVPLFLHIKLLDSTGYEVCGKNVLFPFPISNPNETDRERGQDILQTAADSDGNVVSLSAQGTLPCTAAQYKQVDYWDFSTNFPALAEQDKLMKQASELQAQQQRAKHPRKRMPRPAFYTEGDDRAAGFDVYRYVLQTQFGKSYLVAGVEQQSTAGAWAKNGILFRYKCDQHAHCLLTRSGGAQSLSVTALQ